MSDSKFHTWQKVWGWYHFTPWFKPPQCGVVFLKYPIRKEHHFSKDKDGKCDWYFVWFDNAGPVLFPETCLTDLKEEIENHNKYHSIAPKDISQLDAWMELQKWQVKRIKFYND